MKNEQTDILLTLDKGLQVILHLSFLKKAIPIGELSKELNINKTTLFKILKTLKNRGFVYQEDNGNYGLRVEEFNLIVDRFDQNESLQRKLRPELEQLFMQCNETVTLSVLVDGKVECLDKIDSNDSVHVTQIIGRFSPLHAAASGKVVLAFVPSTMKNKILDGNNLEKFTDHTVISPEILKDELEKIRQDGIAISHGELDLGISAVAAPIFSKAGSVIGSVSILGVTQKFTMVTMENLAKKVMEASSRMSALLKK